jgi:protocatechuate 3,4-dioxygenase beta subunit
MTKPNQDKPILNRRQFMRLSATATAGWLLAACAGNRPTAAVVQSQPSPTPIPPAEAATPADTPPATPTLGPTNTPSLEPTPQCDDHDETPAQTAGPFYTPDTPERASLLEDGVSGTRLVVSGRVLTTECQPIAGAILDFWHCDGNGQYDNVGFRLRGHQFTDANGAYRLETILPGLYPGRTRHIHVKVQGPTTPLLTTQLYFPDEAQNRADAIFHPALVMAVQDAAEGKAAQFDFVFA